MRVHKAKENALELARTLCSAAERLRGRAASAPPGPPGPMSVQPASGSAVATMSVRATAQWFDIVIVRSRLTVRLAQPRGVPAGH